MRATAVVIFTFLFFSISTAQTATQKVLYTFTGGFDGGQPYAGVILNPEDGSLYGVTQTGGAYGQGTVFQVYPSPSGWRQTVLYSFTGGADGAQPVGGLVLDEDGNLYGTTIAGGDPVQQCGTVFKLVAYSYFVLLHTFINGYPDGCYPASNLNLHNGNLYGTTVAGGSALRGTAFRIPPEGGDDFIYSFQQNNRNPWSGVNIWDYGTTYDGGYTNGGNLFQLTWGHHMKIRHTFNRQGKAGYFPLGDVLPSYSAGARVLYGTTYAGGVGQRGTAYQLIESPLKADVWKTKVLHSFSGSDGASPGAGLILDPAGNLYGTTMWGGTDPGYAGTVFKLAPGGPKGKWIHTLLYSFTGGLDGGEVTSGLVRDNAGNLYGTTSSGGAYNQGVVYEVTP